MGLKAIAASFALALGLLAAPASAASTTPPGIAYLSGDTEPWGVNSNIDAMDAAFGSGQWERLKFDDDPAFDSYSMLYIDGSDFNGGELYPWLDDSRRGALESWVSAGGRLFINAATNGQEGMAYTLVFGATTTEGDFSLSGYAVDAGSPLFAGVGTQWSGDAFSHNTIGLAPGYSTLISGEQGQVILAGGAFGNGYVMLGGQTSTFWHQGVDGSDPFGLRVNELRYVATVAAVPEPESFALLLGGLGLVGLVARRRRARASRA